MKLHSGKSMLSKARIMGDYTFLSKDDMAGHVTSFTDRTSNITN